MIDDVPAEPAGASGDPDGTEGGSVLGARAHSGEHVVDPLGPAGGEQEGQALAHCIVAKVAQETNQGEGGLEVRSGIRHFSAGAKVWVLPPQWSRARHGGEKVLVVGRHRGSSGRYVRYVVPRRHLTDFRVRMVYSPALMRALLRPYRQHGGGVPELHDLAYIEGLAQQWNEQPIEARLVDGRWTGHMDMVCDPPPQELRYMRETYHLAHFNARRAAYSRLPPPVESSPPVEPPPPAAQL